MNAAAILTGFGFAGALAFAALSLVTERRAARVAAALAVLIAAPTGLVFPAPELGAALLVALAIGTRARSSTASPAAIILCGAAIMLSFGVGLAGLATLGAWRASRPVTLATLAVGLLAIVLLLDGSPIAVATFLASLGAAAFLARRQGAAAGVPRAATLAHAVRWGAVAGLAAFLVLRDHVAPGASPPRALALALGAAAVGSLAGAALAGARVLLSTAGPARDVGLGAVIAGVALAVGVGPAAILVALLGAATLAAVGLIKTYGALFLLERGPPAGSEWRPGRG